MGTLYVVGVPEGDPHDITVRALRILREVACVVVDDVGHAQHLLAPYEIATPLVAFNSVGVSPNLLENGDVALLAVGSPRIPHGPSQQFIRDAIGQSFPVAAVPGPDSLVAALVISGLPADSFVYLDELPRQPDARRDMLKSVAAEQRTLVIQSKVCHLQDRLSELYDMLGNRALVIVAESDLGISVLWRGTLNEASGLQPGHLGLDRCTLLIGGAPQQLVRWSEKQLRDQILVRLDQGLSVKETSQKLASESGWPRRQIYRLAVEITKFRCDK